jgi:hypothetical protein
MTDICNNEKPMSFAFRSFSSGFRTMHRYKERLKVEVGEGFEVSFAMPQPESSLAIDRTVSSLRV